MEAMAETLWQAGSCRLAMVASVRGVEGAVGGSVEKEEEEVGWGWGWGWG